VEDWLRQAVAISLKLDQPPIARRWAA